MYLQYIEKSDPPIEDVELVEYIPQTFEHLPSRHSKINKSRDSISSSDAAALTDAELTENKNSNTVEAETQDEQHPTAGAFGPVVAKVVNQFTEDQSPSSNPLSSINNSTLSNPLSSTSTSPISLTAYPPPIHSKSPSSRPPSSSSNPVNPSAPHSRAHSYLNFPGPSSDYEPEGFRPVIERQPVQRPVLTENYRYDSREGIVRPYRSHRCRHCATTVLRMDHHCPWVSLLLQSSYQVETNYFHICQVGGCVGAKNHKYCKL